MYMKNKCLLLFSLYFSLFEMLLNFSMGYITILIKKLVRCLGMEVRIILLV